MDLSALQSSPEVRAALGAISSADPCVSALRDGCVIEGHICRFTIGTMILLQSAGNRIFDGDFQDEDEDARSYDVLEAIFLCADESIDDAVWLIQDERKLGKAVKRFARKLGYAGRKYAISTFTQWIADIEQTMPQGCDDGEESSKGASDWWVDAIDIIASEYHWPEDFIIWQLPITRAIRYQEAIVARKSGERRATDISDDAINALEILEKKKADENG